jgi:hypothetical protein
MNQKTMIVMTVILGLGSLMGILLVLQPFDISKSEKVANLGDSVIIPNHVEEVQSTSSVESLPEDRLDLEVAKKEDLKEVIEKVNPSSFGIFTLDYSVIADMTGKSYKENTIIALEDLRLVKVIYYGFDEQSHQGELVVHKEIALQIMSIFRDLYEVAYPIEKIQRVDAYDGDDHQSMIDNNTSAFNYRVVSGSQKLSNHAYGLAIDLNPLMNPYVTSKGVDPVEGAKYIDRTLEVKGMIKEDDPCYLAFTSRGFNWGGVWKNSKDYQHFDIQIKGIND